MAKIKTRTFKALKSPGQMTTVDGRMYCAKDYKLATQEPDVIEALRKNPSWKELKNRFIFFKNKEL